MIKKMQSELKTMVENAYKVAKKNYETDKRLLPVFHIGNISDFKSTMVGAIFENEREKDVIAQMVKKIAFDMSADFIIFISESWSIRQEDTKEFMDNRDKYPSVESFPKRISIIAFMVESHYGCYIATAMIEGEAVGELKFSPAPAEMRGRFTHLLPPKLVH